MSHAYRQYKFNGKKGKNQKNSLAYRGMYITSEPQSSLGTRDIIIRKLQKLLTCLETKTGRRSFEDGSIIWNRIKINNESVRKQVWRNYDREHQNT